MSVRDLILAKHAKVINQGGSFSFSIPYSLDAIKEIEELGETFTSKYLYTVAPIHGTPRFTICFMLKDV
jgi:hypothetical protein